nr:tyrosine-type recombinase/integrase [Mesorhizobium sp. LMG 17147]
MDILLPVRIAERFRPALGEARNLKLSDIDFDAAVLTIRDTKFGKSRLVPMHASTCAVLQDYLKRRRQHCAAQAASPYLFTSQLGNRLDVATFIEHSILCLARSACEAQPTATARACMTCGMCSRRTHWCVGTKPSKILSGSCPFCPPISVMSTWPIPNGTSPVHPS